MATRRIVVAGLVAVVVGLGAFALLAPPPPAGDLQATSEREPTVAELPLATADKVFHRTFEPPILSAETVLRYSDRFTLSKDYNFVEVGLGKEGTATTQTTFNVRIIGPDGTVVSDVRWPNDRPELVYGWNPLDRNEATWFIRDSVIAPPRGEYRLEVEASREIAPRVTLQGFAGAAADFSTQDVLGKGTFRLSEQGGRVVVIDIMTTWCSPCIESMPMLVDVYEAYPRDRVEFVTLDHDLKESEQTLASFMRDHGATWYAGLDREQVVWAYAQKGTSRPFLAVIDPAGQWMYRLAGEDLSPDDLRKAIDAALGHGRSR
ncbi:MAG TPA: TlpA disulfide reductase family protein [Candidatus Thermoplasmatota archaeon]|nr:TlpA disulfide reductase family protein [Candidatus Thermoplasmatota archaeon]